MAIIKQALRVGGIGGLSKDIIADNVAGRICAIVFYEDLRMAGMVISIYKISGG